MKDWQNILTPPDGTEAPLRLFYLLRKRGQTILYLPENRKLADATLRLYPAQTWLARKLVQIVSWFISIRGPVLNEVVTIPVSPKSPFGAFLMRLVER